MNLKMKQMPVYPKTKQLVLIEVEKLTPLKIWRFGSLAYPNVHCLQLLKIKWRSTKQLCLAQQTVQNLLEPICSQPFLSSYDFCKHEGLQIRRPVSQHLESDKSSNSVRLEAHHPSFLNHDVSRFCKIQFITFVLFNYLIWYWCS